MLCQNAAFSFERSKMAEAMDMNDSPDEEETEISRRDRIKQLVNAIKTSKSSMNRKRKMSGSVSGKREDKNQCGARGKHSVYKLYIGWQHYSSEKYRVVTIKKGGGTRLIEYKADEVQTVESIIRKGTQYFFPNRKSQLGDLEDMDLSLASFSGEAIETFTDLEGCECTLQTYLKSHGLFSSQYHLYLRSKRKEETNKFPKHEALDSLKRSKVPTGGNENDEYERILLVNNGLPGNIKLSFRKTKYSTYSNDESSISCASMKTCYGLAANNETPYEQYNCLTDDSFLTTYVSKEDRKYLTQLDDASYQLQDYSTVRGSDVILYGPNEIHGMNDGDLMLGLIALVHNQNDLYQWFKDGELLCEGLNVSFIKVETPGVYSAGIYSGDKLHACGDKCVVKECFMKKDALHLCDSSSELVNQSLFTANLVEPSPTEHKIKLSLPVEHTTQLPSTAGAITHLIVSSEPSTQFPTTSGPNIQWTSKSGPATELTVPPGPASQLLSTSGPTTELTVPPDPASQLLSTSGPTTELTVPPGPASQLLSTSGPTTELTVPPGPASQLLSTSGPTTELTVPPGPASQLLSTSGPTTELTAPPGPDLQLLSTSGPTTELTVPPGPASQLLRTPGTTTELLTVPPGPASQLLNTSGPTTEFTVLPSPTTQLQALPGFTTQLPVTSEQTPHLAAIAGPSTELLSFSGSKAEFATSPAQSKQLPSLPMQTEINEMGCTCLPKVSIADLSFGEEIGRGAFGVIRKATWLGTTVAVKEITVKRMKLAKSLIKQELCIHSRVRHPNIIQLMAYTLNNNKLLMISELNDGRNLDDIIFSGENDDISFEQKVFISRNIIQALAYLHNQSPAIIHRDIKPENILVSSDLKRIRLCDLGISKLKTLNTINTTLDGTSLQPGTPSYQAPEVLLGRKTGNTASDVWSLGCTITELFVEEPAWSIPEDADPVMYIVSSMREGKRPDAFHLIPSKLSANSNIIDMMFKVLSFEINKRPKAIEMLNAF